MFTIVKLSFSERFLLKLFRRLVKTWKQAQHFLTLLQRLKFCGERFYWRVLSEQHSHRSLANLSRTFLKAYDYFLTYKYNSCNEWDFKSIIMLLTYKSGHVFLLEIFIIENTCIYISRQRNSSKLISDKYLLANNYIYISFIYEYKTFHCEYCSYIAVFLSTKSMRHLIFFICTVYVKKSMQLNIYLSPT